MVALYLNAIMYINAVMRTQRRSIGPICTWRMRSRVSYVGVGEELALLRPPATHQCPSVTFMPLRDRKHAYSQELHACPMRGNMLNTPNSLSDYRRQHGAHRDAVSGTSGSRTRQAQQGEVGLINRCLVAWDKHHVTVLAGRQC